MTKCGVLLSGCGFLDGSEVHESVFTMYSLEKKGFELVPLGVSGAQKQVTQHLSERKAPKQEILWRKLLVFLEVSSIIL